MSDALHFRIHNALITALALVCSYALAFVWNLDNPFWAAFTVFMVSLPTIGQSLQKGLLRMLGTLLGAGAALLMLSLFAQERLLLLSVLSLYLSLMIALMIGDKVNGYFFYIASIVAMIIVLISADRPQEGFQLAIYRTEETLLGITVYTVLTLLIEPRSALRTLRSNLEDLARSHGELAHMEDLPDKAEGMRSMYKKYMQMQDRLLTLEQLVPAVRLENYQVYHKFAWWKEALRVSRELLERQRRWTGALETADVSILEQFFPDFQQQKNTLEQFLDQLADPALPLPQEKPKLHTPDTSPQTETPGASEQGLADTIQILFREQVEQGLRLHSLLLFLLHDGPAPELARRPLSPSVQLFSPAQRIGIRQALLFFWSALLLWIFLNPPGLAGAHFPELSILLGLSTLFNSAHIPLHQVLYYLAGSLCAALLYVFVYPDLHTLGSFMGVTFGVAFAVAFLFAKREQAPMKMGFMMPWLAIGDFTNTPAYSVLSLASGSLILLTGITMVSLIQYVTATANTEGRFLVRQAKLYQLAGILVRRLEKRLERPQRSRLRDLPSSLLDHLLLLRLRDLSAELAVLGPTIPVTLIPPEVIRLLYTDSRDIALYLKNLLIEVHGWVRLDPAVRASSMMGAACPMNRSPSETVPRAEEHPGTPLQQALTNLKQQVRDMQGTSHQYACACHAPAGHKLTTIRTTCGGLLHTLDSSLDVARTTPWLTHTEARF